jgi:hypothetical protein
MEGECSYQPLAAIADERIYIGCFTVIDVAGAFSGFLFGCLQAAKVILCNADASRGCEVGAAVGAS